MRESLINTSTLRNDIEVFQFIPDQAGFGTGDAKIVSVRLLDQVAHLYHGPSGERMSSSIFGVWQAKKFCGPIVGFQFKDRLGQVVFADNTFLAYQHNSQAVAQGGGVVARFEFRLPVLPTGDYSIQPLLRKVHKTHIIHHHWMHDALIVRVHASQFVLVW